MPGFRFVKSRRTGNTAEARRDKILLWPQSTGKVVFYRQRLDVVVISLSRAVRTTEDVFFCVFFWLYCLMIVFNIIKPIFIPHCDDGFSGYCLSQQEKEKRNEWRTSWLDMNR